MNTNTKLHKERAYIKIRPEWRRLMGDVIAREQHLAHKGFLALEDHITRQIIELVGCYSTVGVKIHKHLI
ncbi:MAG TPA: hypothetical protein VFD91_17010 [Mariniphaga sp.]|nr:hypothetical protein [Mariniphaga sp.]